MSSSAVVSTTGDRPWRCFLCLKAALGKVNQSLFWLAQTNCWFGFFFSCCLTLTDSHNENKRCPCWILAGSGLYTSELNLALAHTGVVSVVGMIFFTCSACCPRRLSVFPLLCSDCASCPVWTLVKLKVTGVTTCNDFLLYTFNPVTSVSHR